MRDDILLKTVTIRKRKKFYKGCKRKNSLDCNGRLHY